MLAAAAFRANAAKFSQVCESGIYGGADPLVRAGPLDPLLANEISCVRAQQADGGVRQASAPHYAVVRRWENFAALPLKGGMAA